MTTSTIRFHSSEELAALLAELGIGQWTAESFNDPQQLKQALLAALNESAGKLAKYPTVMHKVEDNFERVRTYLGELSEHNYPELDIIVQLLVIVMRITPRM